MSFSYNDFPAISKLLDNRQLSTTWTGWSSASRNVFDDTQHRLRICALVLDNEAEVRSVIRSTAGEEMRGDLFRLSSELQSAAEFFAKAAKDVAKIAESERPYRNQ
jgi:hypothetical protein